MKNFMCRAIILTLFFTAFAQASLAPDEIHSFEKYLDYNKYEQKWVEHLVYRIKLTHEDCYFVIGDNIVPIPIFEQKLSEKELIDLHSDYCYKTSKSPIFYVYIVTINGKTNIIVSDLDIEIEYYEVR